MDRVVLFRFWHLVRFVVGSMKNRQVRRRSRGNVSESHPVGRPPNRYRRQGIRIEGWLRVGSHCTAETQSSVTSSTLVPGRRAGHWTRPQAL